FINTDPQLGPLQNNGGPTQTQALLPGSPAIDAGDNAGCPATDQRGGPRPLDAKVAGVAVCDIGAFEVETLGFIQASLELSALVPPPSPVSGFVIRPGTVLIGTLMIGNGGGARPVDGYVAFLPPAGVSFGCLAGDPIFFLASIGASGASL